MFTRDVDDRNVWHGKVNDQDVSFTVVGTYGDRNNPDPLIRIHSSGDYFCHKMAISWTTGEILKDFGPQI